MYLSYTYYILNKQTGQFYYGSRYKNVKLKRTATDDLWVYYFTSSKEIKALRETYSNSAFEYNILKESENYDECYWYEQSLIKINIHNPLCLNRHYIDNINSTHKFSNAGRKMPKSIKDKEHMSVIMKGKSPSNKGKTTGAQTVNHKNSISSSVAKHYQEKREHGISLAKKTSPARKRSIPFDIVVNTVKEKGFDVAATELNLSIKQLKDRYYYSLVALEKDKER